MNDAEMNATDSIFQRAVGSLLVEIFDGPPGRQAYILNPGDRGLLGQLAMLDARTASGRPTAGKTTIAAHVAHVLYGFTLMNRWIAGDETAFATADWETSWRQTTVNDAEWKSLQDELRRESEAWRKALAQRTGWDDVSAAGVIASAAHTAYHLGAIRQLITAFGDETQAARAPE